MNGINDNIDSLFKFCATARVDRDLIKNIDSNSDQIHPYHIAINKFVKEIGKDVCGNWTSIDLFGWRETSQKNFIRRIHESKNALHPFFMQQVDIMFCAINRLNPKAVVVINANVCHLLIKYFKFEYDEESCIYRTKKIKNIPFYFSGMLSGQRALDTYSRQRMVWHIRKCFTTPSVPNFV